MEVYIEDCILENFFVTLLLLLTTSKLLKVYVKKIRLIIASLLGALFAITYPVLTFAIFEMVLYRIGVGVIICAIVFEKNGFVSKYLCFIFLTALYGGFTVFLYYSIYGTVNVNSKIPTYALLVVLFIIYHMVNLVVRAINKRAAINNFVYKITITDSGVMVEDFAFLDSGNTLLDDLCKEPVFIINSKLFEKLYEGISIIDLITKNYKQLKFPHYVNSMFANGMGRILVFDVDLLEINLGEKKIDFKNAKLGLCYSRFEKSFNCNMLLNINAFV